MIHSRKYPPFRRLTLTLVLRSHETLPSILNIMSPMHLQIWSCFIQRLRSRYIYKKIHKFILILGHKTLPSALYIMWSMYLQNWKVLRQAIYEETRLQEYTFMTFDLYL